jgi:hypothetical protein
MIFICREGIPSYESLLKAESSNSDGGGIAWRETDTKGNTLVRWKKGLKAHEINDVLKELELEKYLPVIIHFRSASQGGNVKELCHPFPITEGVSTDLEGTAKAVLFHNGTYGMWDSAMKEMVWVAGLKMPVGPWSDSRFLAWLAFHRGWTSLRLADWGNGRIVLLDSKGNLVIQGNGWRDGADKGVLQSGELREWSKAVEVYNRHNSPYNRSFERGTPERLQGFPLTTDQKKKLNLLWEEGDEVMVYSQQELDAIYDEMAKDTDILMSMSGA